MNLLNLPPNSDSYLDHCVRALGARRWHCERRSLRGNWFFTFEDAARLRWTIGGGQAKQVLRRLGFELQPDRSWRTFDGPSRPLQLTLNFKTWAVLGGVARHFRVFENVAKAA